MHRLRDYLPSANALFTFEAAARRGSFTAAAEELNVSQPAVSKTIRGLETSLGFRLFRRNHTKLELTAEGKRFLNASLAALDGLHDCIVSMRRNDRKRTVRATFSASFLQSWLLPRMTEFSELHPDIRLTIEESSYDDRDLTLDDIDVSARLGDGGWDDLHIWPLADELIFPVASPAYVASHAAELAALNFDGLRLIHFREKNRVRCTWREWLRANRLAHGNVHEDYVFSDAQSSISAAGLGQGVALGWAHLVMDQIASSRLSRAGGLEYRTGKVIYLIAPKRQPMSSSTEIFITWILRKMQDDVAQNRPLWSR